MPDQKKIVVDAGHGGHDSGTEGAVETGMPTEKVLALGFSTELASRLRSSGFAVQETRNSDVFVSLEKRANIANVWDADLFISCHLNSPDDPVDPNISGMEVLHYPNSTQGIRAAKLVLEELHKRFPTHINRGLKPRGNLYVLKHTKAPAILIEYEFLTNPTQHQWATSKITQVIAADAVTKGVRRFFGEESPQRSVCPTCGGTGYVGS